LLRRTSRYSLPGSKEAPPPGIDSCPGLQMRAQRAHAKKVARYQVRANPLLLRSSLYPTSATKPTATLRLLNPLCMLRIFRRVRVRVNPIHSMPPPTVFRSSLYPTSGTKPTATPLLINPVRMPRINRRPRPTDSPAGIHATSLPTLFRSSLCRTSATKPTATLQIINHVCMLRIYRRPRPSSVVPPVFMPHPSLR